MTEKEFHTLPIELLWERDKLVCTPCYGGLLCNRLDEATTLYFEYETGEAGAVNDEAIEALTGLVQD
uniref:Uncharacterized protein n=1 Tax=viral metagenome TaxID=1070528 RepID=A0A6M3MAN8_9ZZZZ